VDHISGTAWRQFEEEGYANLGRVLDGEHLSNLQSRIDEIMLGEAELEYSKLLMQLDSETGKYEDAPEQSMGWKGKTLSYRKIQNLEIDPVFRAYMELPVFKDLCARIYGEDTPIACFRAMFMNKPAHQGTELPWHQDAWAYLDRQPVLTVWTALDPATIANGCVKAVPGTHKMGRINPSHTSGFLSPEQAAEICSKDKVVYLEAAPGEALALHNWLAHSSEVNRTEQSRRGFSVCYMDARTVTSSGETYTRLFEGSTSGALVGHT